MNSIRRGCAPYSCALKFVSKASIYLITLSIFLVSGMSFAQPDSEAALAIASEYNAFIQNDFSPINYTSSEGKVLAGGDMHLNGHGTATSIDTPPLEYTVISGGDVYYDNGKLYTGSILAAGSTANVSQSVRSGMEPGAVVTEGATLPIDINATFADLQQLSTTLAQLESNGTVNYQWGGIYMDGDCTSDIQVFNLDGSIVQNSHTFSVECVPADATLIFNISGNQTGFQNIGLTHLASYASKSLYNFHEASQVNLTWVGVQGTVLAPFADMENPRGDINGTLIAKSSNGPVALHYQPFTGDLSPLLSSNTEPQVQDLQVSTEEGVSLDFTLLGSDPDGDALSYQIVTPPANGTAALLGDQISYTPNAGFFGEDSMEYLANDGSLDSNVATIAISVIEVNSAPTINSSPVITGTEEQLYSYQVVAVDSDGDTISYSLVTSPTSMTIDDTGLVQWIPAVGEAGDHPVVIRVSDSLGASTEQSYLISVAPKPNSAPVITSVAPTLVAEADLYSYVVEASDPDGDTLTYSLTASPAGMVLNNNTLEWTPTYVDAGDHDVVLVVTDDQGATASQGFTVTVEDTNRAPEITSEPLLAIGESEVYEYVLTAIDPDGDGIVYSLLSAPAGMTLLDGVVSWQPSFDDAGQYTIEIEANDQKLGTDLQSFVLEVTNVNRNPVVTSTPEIVGQENTLYQYQVEASDDDGDELTYSLLLAPAGMTLSDVGLLSWTPDFSSAGDHTIEIIVSDGEVTISQSYILTIANINQAPVAASGSLELAEDTVETITLEANDDDGDTLTLSISSAASNGAVVLDGAQVTYTPNPNFYGTDSFQFQANDGTATSEAATVSITVISVNDAPVLDFTPTLSVAENSPYLLSVQATDIDGDALSYSLSSAPVSMTIDSGTGQITWTPGFADAGSYLITVVALDPFGASASESFDLVVQNTNRAPFITSTPGNLEVKVDEVFTYQMTAEDLDLAIDDVLLFSVVSGPDGLTVDDTSGLVSWMPSAGQTGDNIIELQAQDLAGEIDTQQFTVTVDQNLPPQITSTPEITAITGATYQYSLIADDPDNDPLTYSLLQGPDGMQISSDGLISWEPDEDHAVGITDQNNYCRASGDSEQVNSYADIQVIMDYSPSMTGEWEWVEEMIPALEAGLLSVGIGQEEPNLYALRPTNTTDYTAESISNLVDGSYLFPYAQFVELAFNFRPHSVIEDGWAGIDYVFDTVPLREGAATNFILITDEDRDDSRPELNLTYEGTLQALQDNDVVLNAVLNINIFCEATQEQAIGFDYLGQGYIADGQGGYSVCDDPYIASDFGTSTEDYVGLAIETYGAVWSIAQLRDGGDSARSFSKALQDIKIQEIQRQLDDVDLFDIAIADLSVSDTNISILLTNRGLVESSPIQIQIEVLEAGTTNWEISETLSLAALPAGATSTLSSTLNSFSDAVGVRVSVAPDDATSDCLTTNHSATASKTILEVSDTNGLTDTQSFWMAVDAGASPPAFLSSPLLETRVGQQYRYQPQVQSEIGDDFIYALLSGPAGMQILPYEGTISWTPTIDQIGAQSVLISTTDLQGSTVGQNFDISVLEQDDQNVNGVSFDRAFDVVTFEAQETAIYQPVVFSQPAEQISFSLIVGPPECSLISEQTGGVTCTFGDNLPYVRTFYIHAEDGQGFFDILPVVINRRPEITTSPDDITISKAGIASGYIYTAEDPDGDSFELVFVSGPDGMYIPSGNSMQLVWEPDPTLIGSSASVVARVQDVYGSFVEHEFSINVVVNQAPIFTSDPVVSAISGGEYSYRVIGSDPDSDAISFELIEVPDGTVLESVNATRNDVVWNVPEGISGAYQFTVRVIDADGAYNDQSFEVDVELNLPPVYSTEPVTNAITGHSYTYLATASDPNGDSVTYEFVSGPDGMITVSSGRRLRWTPAIDQVGLHPVTIRATDVNGGETFQNFVIDVALNQPPLLTVVPVTEIAANHNYNQLQSASDPDGDSLTRTLISGPDGLTITNAGRVRWTPTSDQVGSHSVSYTLDDSAGGITTVSYVINVSVNNVPVFTHTDIGVAVVNNSYQYTVSATDQDGDTLSYSLLSGPGDMDLPSNVLRWTPTVADVGIWPVTVQAGDGYGGITTATFQLEVSDSIVFTQVPEDTSTEFDSQYTGVFLAISPSDTVEYRSINLPVGAVLTNRTVRWTPTEEQIGDHQIVIEAFTSGGLSEQAMATVTVTGPNQAPEINPISDQSIELPDSFSLQIVASDPEGGALTYALAQSPAGMSVDTQGVISWVPDENSVGSYSIEVVVTDDENLDSSTTFSLEVLARADNELPIIESVPLAGAIVDTFYSYQILATDADNDPLIYNLISAPAAMTLVGDIVSWTPELADVGDQTITIEVDDGFDTVQQTWTLTVYETNEEPVVTISSPDFDSLITSPTDLIGSISDINLVSWDIYLLPANASTATPANRVGSGTYEINNAFIYEIDPTLLLNGQYDLIIVAIDALGQETQASTTFAVEGDLKVGNFSFTVEDLNVPMAGLPIRVTRTYDTRRKAEDLDFGYGWTIGYQDVRVEESRTPGAFWSLNEYPTGPLGILTNYCVEPQGAPIVSVTLPTGEVERFEAAASPVCNTATPILDVSLVFDPVGDNQSTLEVIGDNSARYANGTLVDTGTFTQPVDPTRYRLTTQSGYEYELDQDFGVERIIDPNGHTLTYTDNGIFHSAGKSVEFVRDAQGRIDQVIDPAGNAIEYGYDGNGDLTSVTERDGAETTHTYYGQSCDDPTLATTDCHLLDEIIDPLGRSLVRNIYDADGRLVAQEDENGNRTEFDHDITGRQSIVTDRNGNSTFFYYDDRGNVTSQVDALGNTRSFTYDAQDNQLSQTDELGNTTSATYNDRNDQLTQTDALGNTITYAYNQRGQETEITDARGNQFQNAYDSVGNLLSVTDPEGNAAGNNINAEGLVSRTIDVLGNETDFTYDGEGNKLTETDPLGTITTYTYDDNNNVLTETRTRTVNGSLEDETTSFEYDSRDRVIRTTDPLGNVTDTEYDLAGNETAVIDPLGRRTEMDYDVYGNLLETRYPDNTAETNTYDAENNLISSTDRAGRTTSYGYDVLNRQVSVTYPDGTSTQTEYDAAGRVAAEIDERGNRTDFEYDAAGRRTAAIDALGNRHEFSYDADGNLTAETDARNNSTQYSYNSLDQRTQTTYADNSTMSEVFDVLGRRTQMTDQAGRSTDYAYDNLGRLLSVTDELGQETSFTYDEQGNKLTQVDAEGRTTSWEYDALGRIVGRTLPEGQSESMAYDASGNMTSHTDFNGNTHSYSYDVNDRLTQIDYADGSQETYTYDDVGNRISATIVDGDGTRTWTYEYDNRDRLTREVKPNGSELSYGYDDAGNKTSLDVDASFSSYSESYTYDVLNRLVEVTDRNSGSTTYTYDDVGNRDGIINANATVVAYSYDALNRLTNLSHTTGLGDPLLSYSYTLDPTGRRTQITEGNALGETRITDYGYDLLYRLVSEDVTDAITGNYSASYTYDAVGNRTQETVNGITTGYTYDDNDRLTQTGSITYSYDANGNTLSQNDSGLVTTYTYNSQNELVTSSESGVSTEYQYNADGIRNLSGDTQYLVDHNRGYAQVLVETDTGLSAELVSYTYGDDLLNQTRTGTTTYYHYDGLGSTRGLTDSTATLTDSYDYEAFGEVLNQTGTTENNYLYTGEQFDATLNQYYLRARYYNQATGRFTQMDTWMGINGDPITLHKYLYADADAVNYIDPTGYMGLASFSASNNIQGQLQTMSVGRVATIGFAANDALYATAATTAGSGLTASQTGLLVIASMGTAGAALFDLLSEKEEEGDEDEGFTLYHGTDIATARLLGAGAPINVELGNCNWSVSCGGFYLADNVGDAEHFAVFTQHGSREGGVVQYDFDGTAYLAIMAISKAQPLQRADRFEPLGNEIIVPPSGFPVFNGFMAQGKIQAGGVR